MLSFLNRLIVGLVVVLRTLGCIAALLAGHAAFCANCSAQSKPPLDAYVLATAEDASLNAIAINSADNLWVVGDRGAVWSTTDGGRNWSKQDSGTTANLYGVAFRDSNYGCAVGGLPGALTRASRGVVLQTQNAGKTWEAVQTFAMPRLTGLRAVGGRLIAWGDYSPLHRTGIFQSTDGGKNWLPLPSSIVHVNALGADPSGAVLAVDRIGNAFSSQFGAARSFFATHHSEPLTLVEHLGSSWIAGGTNGQLMRSVDGQSWSRVNTPLSHDAAQACHWRSIATAQDHIWIAGTPGSIVLHSPNRGVTWQVLPTEQTLPFRAIAFADEQRGWGVGPMGQILATRDGGLTWYVQRKLASKLGLLSVVAQHEQIPWPALAATAWDDGVTAASITAFGSEPAQSGDFRVEPWMCHQALAPQLGLVEHQAWLTPDSTSDKRTASVVDSRKQLVNRLAVELLCWRPDVVITNEVGYGIQQQRNRELIAAVMGAVENAANQSANPLAAELHLPSWKVSKLVAVTDNRTSQYAEQSSRLLRECGLSVWDILQPLGMEDYNAQQRIAMRTLQNGQATAANASSVMGGIAPNPLSKRPATKRNLGNYQLIMGRVHRTSSLERMVGLPLELPQSDWQSQLDFVLRSLPAREVAPMLLHLADLCSAPKLWGRRQFALERLAQLQPDSDAATLARLKLVEMMCSDELLAWSNLEGVASERELASSLRGNATLLITSGASIPSPFDSAVVQAGLTATVENLTVENKVETVVTPASFTNDASSSLKPEPDAQPESNVPNPVPAAVPAINRARQLSNLSQRYANFFASLDAVNRSDTALQDWPELAFMFQAITRAKQEEQPSSSDSFAAIEKVKNLSSLAGWPQIAHQELVLAAGHLSQLRWVTLAVNAQQPPQLDGVLNEPLWSASPPMQLVDIDAAANSATSEATTIRWAYDDQYLYIGIDSPRTVAAVASTAKRTRKYDSDLHLTDHIQLLLDTDRDYSSAIELGVSSQGETYDRVCGISSFNPKWFVAVPETAVENRWTAEIAIRLADLTTRGDLAGRAWAISAYRRSPTGRDQSWSLLKSNDACTQSAGLMLFVPPIE